MAYSSDGPGRVFAQTAEQDDRDDVDALAAALSLINPQGARERAQQLLDRFGSVTAILGASGAGMALAPTALRDRQAIDVLSNLFEVALRREIKTRLPLGNWQAVNDYLHLLHAGERIEVLRALFLDLRNQLIRAEVLQRGTTDQCPVHIREILARALELGASGIILAHNHPSGDVTPSKADIAITRALATAARQLNIVIHDHIIVTRAGSSSLRALGNVW